MKVDIRMKSAGPQSKDETFIKKRTQANLYEKGPKFAAVSASVFLGQSQKVSLNLCLPSNKRANPAFIFHPNK